MQSISPVSDELVPSGSDDEEGFVAKSRVEADGPRRTPSNWRS